MANLPINNETATQNFFNGYFNQPLQVSDEIFGQVYGFFFSLTNSSDAANALSQSVIALSYNNNLNPLDLISQFNSSPNGNNIKNLLISFFNNSKGATSKLGYKKNTSVPPIVARNILS